MALAQLHFLLEQQNELFENISEAITLLKSGSKITNQRIQARMVSLNENWLKFKDNHDSLGSGKASQKADARAKLNEESYFKEKMYRACEQNYLEAVEQMSTMLEDLPSNSTKDGAALADISNIRPTNTSSSVRLPRLELQTFSGEYSEWVPFKDMFTSVIGSNPSLTLVEKLQYLKAHLVGKAAERFRNVTLTAANFQTAWDDLIAYYDNKRILIDSALQTLFTAKSVNIESASELETLYSVVNQALGALDGLGRSIDHWDDVLVYLISRKLDAASIKEWERSLGSSTEPPTWDCLKGFLISRIRSLQAYERATPDEKITSRSVARSSKYQQNNVKSHHVVASSSPQTCSNCKYDHYIASCPSYQSKTLDQRKALIKQLKLCFNCLGHHQVSKCFSKKRCQNCGIKHHTSIHPQNSETNQLTITPGKTESSFIASANVASIQRAPNLSKILTTALVQLFSISGEPFIIRALLDQGSEINLASEYLRQLLRLPSKRSLLSIVGIGAGSSSSHPAKGLVSLKLQSCVNEFTCNFDAYVLPKLTNYLPSSIIVNKSWPHIQGLELADPEFYQPGRIDLILGVEIYGQILQKGLRKGPKTAPIAQQTSLGWIISGSAYSSAESTNSEAQSLHCHLDYELDDLLKKFWIQEEVFSSLQDKLTAEEVQCEEHFKSTHSRTPEGRYMVKLPFKSKPTCLGDSRTPALKMLHRMQNRFASNPSFRADYSKFIKEYEDLGHMCRAFSHPRIGNLSFYLPHHGVVRECSTTTKLRVVFNGSLKTNQGISLNEFLHEGPKLQVDLPDVLTRWRKNQFAYSSDVVKMFRQILVHPDDWDYQRILWFEDSKLIEFQLTTVTYGTTSAPYLANKALRQLSVDESHRYPKAKGVIEEGTYVDDVYDGAPSIEEGREKIKNIISLFKAGGFPLQKWAASHEELLEAVSDQDRASSSATLSIEDGPIHRTLGLNWQPKLDRFIFIPVTHEEPKAYTKRIVLSRTAQLFDPLGWLSPVIVRAKIFMQELWQANLDWDEPIPNHLETRWKSYINQLKDLSLISVPRWLGLSPSSLSVELHGFADASQAALGAVVYLRVIRDLNTTQVTIISSKSKVTPIKRASTSSKRSRNVRITIPRLELSAALLLTRHIEHLRRVLKLNTVPIHLWTDSSTTLYWIKAQPSRWKDFVRNRVSQIQEILPEAQWHHLPGEENPADLASRGVSPRQLSECALWWYGPSWLILPSEHWPQLTFTLEENAELEERHKIVAITREVKPLAMWDLIYRYSSLTRLLRITAWCKRALLLIFNIKKSQTLKYIPLQPEELEEAKIYWIKSTQKAYFLSEINKLSKLEPVHQTSSIYRLTPFIDSQGILRIGGRLRNAQIDQDMKHPIILPRESPLTNLILDHTHRETMHGGVQLMLATLRRNYWIIGGRNPVRCFIHRCVTCARYRALTSKQLMGQLPINRTLASRPFYHSGVDYAGPFTLKTWRGRGAKTYKGYLVVFVCFSSSAVHLELATDYSTEGFLAAFKRFTSRRGICSTLSSDCGTNLIGADAELRKLFNAASKEIQHLMGLLANDGTKWIFNPPASPHFGGKWEAAVKSTKFHIKRVIGDTVLTYEEFSTLLTQVEAILNSRPLCPLSEDPNDLEALTPGHFIIGEAIKTVPEPSVVHIPVSRLSRYQLVKQMIERFWQRWSIEYLQRLQEIVKWHNPSTNIKEGNLVLVVDERYPPSKWPLARVIAIHPGADGLTRVVTVKTQTTTLKRPIVKLCLLPICSEVENKQSSPDPSSTKEKILNQRSLGDVEAGGKC